MDNTREQGVGSQPQDLDAFNNLFGDLNAKDMNEHTPN